jgi:hypothetical protein
MSARKTSKIEDETRKLININTADDEKDESIFLNKYFALGLMVCSVFGQNFVIDNPAGMSKFNLFKNPFF